LHLKGGFWEKKKICWTFYLDLKMRPEALLQVNGRGGMAKDKARKGNRVGEF